MTDRRGHHGRLRATAAILAVLAVVVAGNWGDTMAVRAASEQDVQFTSGGDTLYGSLLLPDMQPGQRVPAAVIISGSGPTDRDGNSALLNGTIDSNKFFARTLADRGVASLRYDKLGTGKTGIGAHASNPAEIGFNLFVDEATAAYAYLRSRPEVDPQRVMILGHSEGGLIALVVANQLKGTPDQPAALVLAAPLGTPYLETIRRQITDQYRAGQAAGQISQADADAAIADLNAIVKSLTETQHLPATIATPALQQLFSPTNEKFLGQVAPYDPMQLAASLPPTMPALILHGTKDVQISPDDVNNVLRGFQTAGNTRAALVELANVDHVFKEVPGDPDPANEYTNPNLAFSREAADRLADFVANTIKAP
jgi:acetyl esterase/lipase